MVYYYHAVTNMYTNINILIYDKNFGTDSCIISKRYQNKAGLFHRHINKSKITNVLRRGKIITKNH